MTSPFISFYASVLSRLSYFDDNLFLKCYNHIVGNIIPEEYLTIMDNTPFESVFDDTTYPEPKIDGNVDIIKLGLPQVINKVYYGHIPLRDDTTIQGECPHVKYISLSNSNYRGIYILTDIRMPNSLWILFRGTYSTKSLSSYLTYKSLIPYTACKNDTKFVRSIMKLLLEVCHTIIESMKHLHVPSIKKIYVTGHSLGGGLSTLFSYLWTTTIPLAYPDLPYKPDIICITQGCPRVLSDNTAKHFCELVTQKRIMYLRLVTLGDTITKIPPKLNGFYHPCKDTHSKYCNPSILTQEVDYSIPLGCTPISSSKNSIMKSHSNYMYIDFRTRDLAKRLFKGVYSSLEIHRKNLDTVLYMVLYDGQYKSIYVNLVKLRDYKALLPEDLYVTQELFQYILSIMIPTYSISNLHTTVVNILTSKSMPSVICDSSFVRTRVDRIKNIFGGTKKNKIDHRRILSKTYKHHGSHHKNS